jgi:hypothetical protein
MPSLHWESVVRDQNDLKCEQAYFSTTVCQKASLSEILIFYLLLFEPIELNSSVIDIVAEDQNFCHIGFLV